MVAKKKKQKMYAGYEPQGELVDENIAAKTVWKCSMHQVRVSGVAVRWC